MEDTATDYKLLYEQALDAHRKVVAEKDEQIQALNFELDKYKRYIFGKKNEKLAGVHTDANQIDLFELGTDQQQQEELSQQAADVVKEKAPLKNVEREREECCFLRTCAVRSSSLNPPKTLPAETSSEKRSLRC
ncbi:IS66 family transposase [Dyadobacter crusticola]|uniref:IS66 family transposase n=1 Tax=Dyadobacter crusticola TaxID=292407 RepID=UPI000558C686|nr:hypothetical protein [Dyadobacter crusticola]